jgi:signal peptidase I
MDVNPYAPMPASSEPPARQLAPRWLAILVTIFGYPFAGAGLLVLRRSKRDLPWLAISVLLFVGYVVVPSERPRWALPCFILAIVLWIAGLVATCIGRREEVASRSRMWLVAVGVLLVAQGTVQGTKAFLAEAFQIPVASMAPTLLVGDRLHTDKRATRPSRGDVIVFEYPPDPATKYIKRVIGLPGETVSIERDQVIIDGKPLPRRLLEEPCPEAHGSCEVWEEQAGAHTFKVMEEPGRRTDFEPFAVPANAYFVLGDNRNDSRAWGPVPQRLVVARATVLFYSAAPGGPIRWERIGKPIE